MFTISSGHPHLYNILAWLHPAWLHLTQRSTSFLVYPRLHTDGSHPEVRLARRPERNVLPYTLALRRRLWYTLDMPPKEEKASWETTLVTQDPRRCDIGIPS